MHLWIESYRLDTTHGELAGAILIVTPSVERMPNPALFRAENALVYPSSPALLLQFIQERMHTERFFVSPMRTGLAADWAC